VGLGHLEPGSRKGIGRICLARTARAVAAGPPVRPMAADAEPAQAAWRARQSPLFFEEQHLGGVGVLDARQALHLPCTVTELTVQGNQSTRRQLIEREMQAALRAKTHQQLAAELLNANARLYDLDVFRKATCHVDAGDRDEDVTVRVVVEEKGAHTVSTGTFVQEGEGCLEVAWSLRNFAENAEQVRMAVSGGFNQSSSVRLDFVRPYVMGNYSLHCSLAQTSKHVPRPKSLREIQQALSVTLEQRDGPHAFTYEICSRRLDGISMASDDGGGDGEVQGWKLTDVSSQKVSFEYY
jgi:outer membrane protein assembly factor BamA